MTYGLEKCGHLGQLLFSREYTLFKPNLVVLLLTDTWRFLC